MRKRIESLGQSLMLSVPLLSEMRLGADRVMAFLRAWHYIRRARIVGDYLEFGVMEGMTFKLSLRAASKFISREAPYAPRFFAFDSFEGLPEPDPIRDGTTWKKGDYSAKEEVFLKNIRRAAKDWKVEVIRGFYESTLRPCLIKELGIEKAAFITIDCDLYTSTIQALRFISPIVQTGTVIYFDDWYFSHGDLSLGEAGACAEWLRETPGLLLVDYGDVGIMGKCFLVQRYNGNHEHDT